MRLRIDDLLGLIACDSRSKIFAMMQAYLDESGIHNGAQVCVICGYFGGPGQWRKFEKLWRHCLTDFHVPLEQFHAKDVVKCRGFFGGWDQNKRDRFLSGLSRAVHAYKIYPLSYGVFVEDFWTFSERDRRFFTGAHVGDGGRLVTPGCPSRPYIMAFQHALQTVASHTEVGGKSHFFLGIDRALSQSALALFRRAKSQPNIPFKERIGDIAFPLAKETPQLQAADLLCYLTVEHMLERTDRDFATIPSSSLLLSLVQKRLTWDDTLFIDRNYMQRCISAATRPVTAEPA